MTIQEYISNKLSAFGPLSEAELVDFSVSLGMTLDTEYSTDNAEAVGKALCSLIEEKVLAPRVESVSESGFSMSYHFDDLGKYYWYLCKKYGVTPDDDVLALLGISTIIDRTNIW